MCESKSLILAKAETKPHKPGLDTGVSWVQQQQHITTNELSVQCIYQDETYQEIVNLMDFSFESLWSNAGGFIGMMLGYSVLQIPEAIYKIWDLYRKRSKRKAQDLTKA